MIAGVPTVTKEEMVARAAALVPALAERSSATDAERRIPPVTISDLVTTGLNRIGCPRRWGGYGLDFDAAWEVGRTLAHGCGSTAWCYMVAQVHNWQVGFAPERAQAEYFLDPDVWSSSAFAPTGTVEPADGGWLVSGRWPFSSGVDHSDWALLGAFSPERGEIILLLLPRCDYGIVDDWFVSGLRGTGSKTVVVERPTLVPEHRWTLAMGGPQRHARDAHGRASYGAPVAAVLPFTLVAPLVGMAEGMIDAFVERGRKRSRRRSSRRSRSRPGRRAARLRSGAWTA
jgi:3-hydroxy-9,10-secoandrosta-1,3,5(10)-triene-9,17-dione monooxygenase